MRQLPVLGGGADLRLPTPGAPARIGIVLAESAVSRYMVHHRRLPSARWRTFQKEHVCEILAADLFSAWHTIGQ